MSNSVHLWEKSEYTLASGRGSNATLGEKIFDTTLSLFLGSAIVFPLLTSRLGFSLSVISTSSTSNVDQVKPDRLVSEVLAFDTGVIVRDDTEDAASDRGVSCVIQITGALLVGRLKNLESLEVRELRSMTDSMSIIVIIINGRILKNGS